MNRLFLCVVLSMLAATPLLAVDSDSLSGSVPPDRRLTYLYEVDFGSSAVSWSLSANVSTSAPSGLTVRLMDLDALAASNQLTSDAINAMTVSGQGTANVSLSGTYSGLREFVVEIETASGGSSSGFSGSVTVSTGTLTRLDSDVLRFDLTGLRTQVKRLAFWDRTVPAATTIPAGVELDFGATERTLFVRFEGSGQGITRMDLMNITGGTSNTLVTLTNLDSGQATSVAITGTGRVTLRVNVVGAPGGVGFGSWALTPPSGILLRDTNRDTSDDDNDGCSTGQGPKRLPWLMVAALVSAILLGWRRYANTSTRCPRTSV
jgi:hypothetical protein